MRAVATLLFVVLAGSSGGDGWEVSPCAICDRHWRSPVASFGDLPADGNQEGDARMVVETATPYLWDGAAWVAAGSDDQDASEVGFTPADDDDWADPPPTDAAGALDALALALGTLDTTADDLSDDTLSALSGVNVDGAGAGDVLALIGGTWQGRDGGMLDHNGDGAGELVCAGSSCSFNPDGASAAEFTIEGGFVQHFTLDSSGLYASYPSNGVLLNNQSPNIEGKPGLSFAGDTDSGVGHFSGAVDLIDEGVRLVSAKNDLTSGTTTVRGLASNVDPVLAIDADNDGDFESFFDPTGQLRTRTATPGDTNLYLGGATISTSASSSQNVIIGGGAGLANSTSHDDEATVIGYNARSLGSFMVAVGHSSDAAGVAVAVGGRADCDRQGAICIGYEADVEGASGNFGIAIGYTAQVDYLSVGLGRAATPTADSQLVVGSPVMPISDVYFGEGPGGDPSFTLHGDVTVPDALVLLASVPSAASDACTANEIAVGGGYLYSCVASGDWRRVSLSTW